MADALILKLGGSTPHDPDDRFDRAYAGRGHDAREVGEAARR